MDPMTPTAGPDTPRDDQPVQGSSPTPPAPPDATPPPPAPPTTNLPPSSAGTNAPDAKDAQIADLTRQLAELQAASERRAFSDLPDDTDPNDTAGTKKAPPSDGQHAEHVYFDPYDKTVPGGRVVHQPVVVVGLERSDDGDAVLGAYCLALGDLPLIPLAHLRYEVSG